MKAKQLLRTFGSLARQAQQAQAQRERAAQKAYKQLQKEQEIADVAEAVADYEAYLNLIQTLHHYQAPDFDWQALQNQSPPQVPKQQEQRQKQAKLALEKYQPNFIDKLFGLAKKRRKILEQNYLQAIEQDQAASQQDLLKYTQTHENWADNQSLAKQILLGQTQAYEQALDLDNPLESLEEWLEHYQVHCLNAHDLELQVLTKTDEFVPDFILAQTTTGKLSRKKMPQSRFNEIYQDYVCSLALRLALEYLAYLPLKRVLIQIQIPMLNRATGYMEEQTILSVLFPKASLTQLNLSALDPSDAMRNFIHTMSFSKTQGFQAVEPLDWEDLPNN